MSSVHQSVSTAGMRCATGAAFCPGFLAFVGKSLESVSPDSDRAGLEPSTGGSTGVGVSERERQSSVRPAPSSASPYQSLENDDRADRVVPPSYRQFT